MVSARLLTGFVLRLSLEITRDIEEGRTLEDLRAALDIAGTEPDSEDLDGLERYRRALLDSI